MPTVGEIDKVLSLAAPKELSESWDNDGVMFCSHANATVNKALVALDATDAAVSFAADNGFDCIVTHHPFIFSPLSRINSDVYGIFKILMDAGISVLSYHTRMDSAVGGVNDCLAEILNLNNIAAFGGESGKIGRVGELSEQMSPEEFANFLKEKLHCGNIRAAYFDDENKKIKRVAVVGGAGKSFLYEAFCAGADAFVTSEAAHNTFYDAKKLGMCVYDCGHYYTENQICRRFEQILKDNFGDSLEVYSFNTGSPYINI